LLGGKQFRLLPVRDLPINRGATKKKRTKKRKKE
jgi:hypothetical protein